MGCSLTRMTQKSVGWGAECGAGVCQGEGVLLSQGWSCTIQMQPGTGPGPQGRHRAPWSRFPTLVPWRRATKSALARAVQPCVGTTPPAATPGSANLTPACVSAEGSPLGAGSWRTWEISHNDLNRPRFGSCFPWKPVRSRSKERRDHKKRT